MKASRPPAEAPRQTIGNNAGGFETLDFGGVRLGMTLTSRILPGGPWSEGAFGGRGPEGGYPNRSEFLSQEESHCPFTDILYNPDSDARR